MTILDRPEIVASAIGGAVLLGTFLGRALVVEPAARSREHRFALLKEALQQGYQPAVAGVEQLYEAVTRGAELAGARQSIIAAIAKGGFMLPARRETDLNLAAQGDLSADDLLVVMTLLRNERESVAQELVEMTAG